MTNIAEARRIVALARKLGVSDFCVCAGSRNSPLLAVLAAESSLTLLTFVDERSAAFFALGRAKVTERPAAVVTTSGTAAAELLPAAIEAHYSGTPLILITADRPARYRGTGAPQSIEQESIFGCYADRDVESWNGERPLHLNVEFDEPLIDEVIDPWNAGVPPASPAASRRRAASAPPLTARPLLILGGLAARDRARVRDFALQLNAPVYAEPLSGLREDNQLAHLLITAGERMIARGMFDGVVRIGGVPTLRFWRDLDESRRDLPLVSFSALPFAGLSRGEVYPIEALPEVRPRDRDDVFFADDRARAAAIARILDDEPQSELAMVRALSSEVPSNARIYLGNSLPIREWDLAAIREPRDWRFDANRGANGIDGQLATFFGQCDRDRANVCVVGDLTALYDLNAPWIVPQLDRDLRFQIVIINNGGGRIFERVASLRALDPVMRDRIVENAHTLRFDDWAKMWSLIYERSDRLVVSGHHDRSVLDLLPDAGASLRAWERYDALW